MRQPFVAVLVLQCLVLTRFPVSHIMDFHKYSFIGALRYLCDIMAEQMHPSFMNVIKQKERIRGKMAGVKHRIGVYSAKVGVGKTTVSVNLAYTLAGSGRRVGLLDADIDCPNISMFLGISERMDTSSLPLKPIVKNGIKVASTAMLVDDEKRPIIWRGPMVAKMIADFFENTEWGELDYLIIDLSPGTSDSPLSLMQLLDLDGILIVTTPQRIAGINSLRSGLMAKRMNVPILGVVENMSSGQISESTKDLISRLDTVLLGTVAMNSAHNAASDSGRPSVLSDKKSKEEFLSISERILG